MITIGNADSAVIRRTSQVDQAATPKPMTALSSACADDDLVDVEARRADGAQRREFGQMILGAGIKRLRDDDRADDGAQQRAAEERGAGAGAEQPESAAAVAESVGRQHFDLVQFLRQRARGPPRHPRRAQHAPEDRRLVRAASRYRSARCRAGEDIRRGGERPDAVGDRRHLDLLVADRRSRRRSRVMPAGRNRSGRRRRRGRPKDRRDCPATKCQGCKPAGALEPTTKTGVDAAARHRPFRKSDDAAERHRSRPAPKAPCVRSRSSSMDGSSKHFVPRGTIQRSAGAWSIMVVTMLSKPRNSPSWTVTRHDREDDTDDRRDEAQPVLEQVSRRQLEKSATWRNLLVR